MVRALCCLHNWLIDEHDNGKVPQSTAADRYAIMNRGGTTLNQVNTNQVLCIDNNRMSDALDGGEHFDDSDFAFRRNRQRVLFRQENNSPRNYLFNKIVMLGMTNRPKPMGSTTTTYQ